MKIAVCSDEYYPAQEILMTLLEERGHEIIRYGALNSKQNASWVKGTEEAANAITSGFCEEGIFFCWSGTGAAIAANKVKGIRAALCWDVDNVRLARIWNHANVLVLPNKLLEDLPFEEILNTWFADYDKEIGAREVGNLS